MINKLTTILPNRMIAEIQKIEIEKGFIEEIRIRRNRQAYMVVAGQNVVLNIVATDYEMKNILACISHNSLYAYRDTIVNGYISLENGIRIGVAGRAGVEDNRVIGVYEINEFSIRIPNNIIANCSEIKDLAKNSSILIYSPPGEGKTTLLRSLILKLTSGKDAKRVGVIDTRAELLFGLDRKDLLVSVLVGYPRKVGIEIAVRSMNSQIIVCDEIGDDNDACAIIDAQGAGVPIIASCHGSSLKDILSHRGIRNLHHSHIFDYYIGIKRSENLSFDYSISDWEGANAFI